VTICAPKALAIAGFKSDEADSGSARYRKEVKPALVLAARDIEPPISLDVRDWEAAKSAKKKMEVGSRGWPEQSGPIVRISCS
jgi:hypothetical protein